MELRGLRLSDLELRELRELSGLELGELRELRELSGFVGLTVVDFRETETKRRRT